MSKKLLSSGQSRPCNSDDSLSSYGTNLKPVFFYFKFFGFFLSSRDTESLEYPRFPKK